MKIFFGIIEIIAKVIWCILEVSLYVVLFCVGLGLMVDNG